MAGLLTIKENNTFRRLYRSKKCYVYPQIVVYVSRNRLGVFRYGITTGKKIGKAVMRNRSRRIIREAYRMISDDVRQGVDLVFVARGRTPFVKSTDILRAMKKELKEAGVLK